MTGSHNPTLSNSRRSLIGLGLIALTELTLRWVLFPDTPSDAYIIRSIAVEWFFAILLLTYWVPLVERLPLRSLGVTRFRLRYLWIGLAVFCLQLVVTIAGAILEYADMTTLQDFGPVLGNLGWQARVGLFTAGAFPEEIFYRGYLIERLTTLSGSLPLAAFVSWITFSLIHLPFFGLGPTLQTGILSAALVILYIRERSIWPCVVVHTINNALAYLLFPWILF